MSPKKRACARCGNLRYPSASFPEGHLCCQRDLGLPLRAARISVLRQLVLQVPAPVIADALGFHHTTTTRQHANAGATWSRYAGNSGQDH